MTPRIQKAIDIFLDSLNNGTLVAGNCSACAVGNLVAEAFGIKYHVDEIAVWYDRIEAINREYPPTVWTNFFMNGIVKDNNDASEKKAMDIICKQTGFTLPELAAIERAFESNCYLKGIGHDPIELRKSQIEGLAAVVEVMMGFDGIQEDVQEVFISKAELIPID